MQAENYNSRDLQTEISSNIRLRKVPNGRSSARTAAPVGGPYQTYSRLIEATDPQSAFSELDKDAVPWEAITNARSQLRATAIIYDGDGERDDNLTEEEKGIEFYRQGRPITFDLKLRVDASSLQNHNFFIEEAAFVQLIACSSKDLNSCGIFSQDDNTPDNIGSIDDFFSPRETAETLMTDIYNGTIVPNSHDHNNEYTFQQQLDLPTSSIGVFHIHAIFVALVQSPSGVQTKLFQMATLFPVDTVTILSPTNIVNISLGSEIFQLAIIIITDIILLFALFQLWIHRNHMIMRLSQSSFLMASTLAGILAISLTYFFRLDSDLFCSLRSLSMVPMSSMYAIAISRLWRIHSLVFRVIGRRNSLESVQESTPEPWIFKCLHFASMEPCFRRRGRINLRTGTIRRSISSWALSRLILVLTLPVIMVTFVKFIHGDALEPQYSNEGTVSAIGIMECRERSGLLNVVLLGLFFLMQVLAAGTAYVTKDLPALFNETSSIFRCTWTTMVWMMIIMIAILVSDHLSTPDLSFVLHSLAVSSVVLNMTFHIVFPKLRAVWNGDDIDVQEYLQGYQRERRRSSVVNNNDPIDPLQVYARRSSRTRRFSIESNHLGVTAQASATTGTQISSEYNENGFVIDEDGIPPKRFLNQIISTMNSFNSILLSVSEDSPISRYHWNVLKARTSALSEECGKLIFKGDKEGDTDKPKRRKSLKTQESAKEESYFPIRFSGAESNISDMIQNYPDDLLDVGLLDVESPVPEKESSEEACDALESCSIDKKSEGNPPEKTSKEDEI